MAQATPGAAAPKPLRNWRTTMGAIIGALGLLLIALKPLIDNDPATVADPNALITTAGAFFAALGFGFSGLSARDAGVTSEGTAVPAAAPKAPGAAAGFLPIIFALSLVLGASGCASEPDLRPTVAICRDEFKRLEVEATAGAIILDPDPQANARRLKARLAAMRQNRLMCEAALAPPAKTSAPKTE